MAAHDGHFDGGKTLPTIQPKRFQIQKTKKEMRYRAFAKPLMLPSLDLLYADLDKLSTLFSKKQLCKKVSEWFTSWRPWQQRILLCSMTEKCSKNQLHALITSLEPVFHRDFVAQLKGSYPTRLLQPRFVHTMSSMVEDAEFRRYRGLEPVKRKTPLQEEGSSVITESTVDIKESQNLERLEKMLAQNEEIEDEEDYEACYHEVAVEEGVEFDHFTDSDLPLASFAVTPAADIGVFPSRRHEHAPPFQRKVSTRNFFPNKTNAIAKLGIMKSVHRLGDGERVYGADPVSFKSSKWWQGHKGPKLLKPRRSKLSKYFKTQLNQINQWLENWSPHERVDMLAEVVKCCDPDSLNFFALCLSSRLRDQTGIDNLPDHILYKVFSYLDVKSLCRSSQVCRRWRYLCQDGQLWRRKLRLLGTREGIFNLPKKVEAASKNQHVDWKQAYQEVTGFYEDLTPAADNGLQEDEEETEKPELMLMFSGVKPPSLYQQATKGKEQADSPSGHELVDIVVIQSLNNVGPAQSPSTADQRKHREEFESKQEDQNDLTGGNLKMLAKSLRALMREKDSEPEEDVALDIRPSLVQAANLLDKKQDHTKFRYLSLAIQGVLAVKKVTRLQGHMDGVYCLQFDTRRVMTGSLDRTIRVWDVRSGRSIRKIKGHKGGIRCLQFDNSKIVTGSWDMTIMVWHIVHFTRLHVLYGHRGCVSCLQFDDHFLVSGSHDRTIRIWDTTTWECNQVIQAHDATVTCLEFDGEHILSGSIDRTLKLWNVHTAELIRVFEGHNDAVASLKILGRLVISGSVDGMIMFWDLDSGICEAAIQAHEGPVHSISTCGDHFLSGGGDNLIKEWDMGTCTCLRTLQGHRGAVLCVKANVARILSCSSDGTVRIWDLDQPQSQNTSSRVISVKENTIEAKVVKYDRQF